MTQIHSLQQGTDAWHQFRAEHFGASEAAAMLGLSKNVTRSELLRMKHTGTPKEFSEWVQANVLDRGHLVESTMRPMVEEIVGQTLYPVTLSQGRLSASCDGLTADDGTAWECKQWNERAAEYIRRETLVPPEHMPQCQQVLMLSGAARLLFSMGDGTQERFLVTEVLPDPAWFERIRDGWAQFEQDLAAYVLPEAAAPAPVGHAPKTLPALLIDVTGHVTASNLPEFKATALAAIRSVNRTLTTDQDFADAVKAIKWCADVESRLEAAKQHALSQTASIDALFKAMDDIKDEARDVRLGLDKLVMRRKTEVKEEAVSAVRCALIAHYGALNDELEPAVLLIPPVDFAGAIKNLRSFDSMQNALDTLLAKSKIEADAAARSVRTNQAAFKEQVAGFEFLFADLGQLVHKAPEDFGLAVRARIDAHKVAEAEKEHQRKVAEDARVAAAAAAATAAADKAAADKAAADAAEVQRQAAAMLPAVVLVAPAPAAAPAPMPTVQPVTVPRAPAAEPPTLKLGQINERLGYTVTADLLARLGFVAHTDRSAKLFREGDFRAICVALAKHTLACAAHEAMA